MWMHCLCSAYGWEHMSPENIWKEKGPGLEENMRAQKDNCTKMSVLCL